MDAFTGRGTVGRLLYVYQQAALLHDWSFVAKHESLDDIRVRISARCSAINSLWIRQQDLTVALRVGREEWRWALERVQLDGVQLSAIASGVPDVITLR